MSRDVTVPRYEHIAREISRRIRDGELRSGDALTATGLAAEHGVARGTARHALETVVAEEGTLSRVGARWVVHECIQPQRLDSMMSFAQWARATGHVPSGRMIRSARGRATTHEASGLGVPLRSPVFRVERLRALDDRPVLVERTTYPPRLAGTLESLPPDTPSVMAELEARLGIRVAHAELRIGAVGADPVDAELLDVARRSPLVRVRRTTRGDDGVAFEHSEDRCLPDAVEFSLVESAR
ncbi:GntR family transcriptional regulator [Microbacterium sp. gxy059]|uniref:GntR family transcriptional regulator n=1 Tax=Microbacterium sp. gxy059 TaxID=2957199 RepID=UPI003D9895A1